MIVFFVGGTGNQVFQLRSESDIYSDFFLKSLVCNCLGWTRHPFVLRGIRKAPFSASFAALFLLFLDFILISIKVRPLFGVIDLRGYRGVGFFKLYSIGYFQHNSELDEFRFEILRETFNLDSKSDRNSIVVHVRGGDVVKLQTEGRNMYGVLPNCYYEKAIECCSSTADSVLAVTNDAIYAKSVLGPDVDIHCGSKAVI